MKKAGDIDTQVAELVAAFAAVVSALIKRDIAERVTDARAIAVRHLESSWEGADASAEVEPGPTRRRAKRVRKARKQRRSPRAVQRVRAPRHGRRAREAAVVPVPEGDVRPADRATGLRASDAVPAAAKPRAARHCRKCGREGARADGCGTSHEPLNAPAAPAPSSRIEVIATRASSVVDIKPPPHPGGTASPRSKQLPRVAQEPSSDDEDEPAMGSAVMTRPLALSERVVELLGHVVDDVAQDTTAPELVEAAPPPPPPLDEALYPSGRRRRDRASLGLHERSRTTAPKQMRRVDRAVANVEFAAELAVLDQLRPKTREECRGGERPCPFVGCRHHFYLDVNPETGSVKINFPDLEPWELTTSCVLDVAEAGAVTLEAAGRYMNVTRERLRQIEILSLLALKQTRTVREIGPGAFEEDRDPSDEHEVAA